MLKTITNSINASQIQTPITLPGDVTLSSGNLVIGTSGKGIDFSATSGAGTSELLSDYEEGTWTPNQGGGLTVTGAFSSAGTYTKIGRQVTVIGVVSGATSISVSAIGIICSNLPFNVVANTSGSVVAIFTGVTNCLAAGGSADLYSVGALSTTNTINFTVTYFV